MKRNISIIALALVMAMTSILIGQGQQEAAVQPGGKNNSRHVPARTIPAPTTVSPELRKVIALPLRSTMNLVPKTSEEWRSLVASESQRHKPVLAQLRSLFPVDIQSELKAGVKTYTVTPETIAEENANRILVHLHGGGYVFNSGEAGLGEAILMAYYGKIKVVSVDYRMPPDFPFPAALDDAVMVYNEIIKTYKPSNTGIFGTSAGGGLTAATVLKLRELNIAPPGAVGLGTPWADLTRTGDTLFTNEYIDDVLITYEGFLDACAKLYTGSHNMKDPLISPVYGDFTKGFPATILTSGTRDMLLSDTVRMHRKLRQAGVEADLQIFEGMSHAQYILVFTSPESREAFQGIARFFGNHLGK